MDAKVARKDHRDIDREGVAEFVIGKVGQDAFGIDGTNKKREKPDGPERQGD